MSTTAPDLTRPDTETITVPLWMVLEMVCSTEWQMGADRRAKDRVMVFLGRGRVDLHYSFRRAFPTLNKAHPPSEWDAPGAVFTWSSRDEWVERVADYVGWSAVEMSPFPTRSE